MTEEKEWHWDNVKRVSYYIDKDGNRHETKENKFSNPLKPVVFPVYEED